MGGTCTEVNSADSRKVPTAKISRCNSKICLKIAQ